MDIEELIRLADPVRDADIETPMVTTFFESHRGRSTNAKRLRLLRPRFAWAWFAIIVVLILVLVVGKGGVSSPRPSGIHPATTARIPVGSLSDLTVVGSGGGNASEQSPPPDEVDVINPATGAVSHYALGGTGGIDYPWVVEGDVLVAIEDRPSGNSTLAEGTAMAFIPTQPATPAWSLGSASDVIPSVTPGDVWIASTPTTGRVAQPSTIKEETVTGIPLTPSYPFDGRRWLIAAVDGGFLSVPVVPPNDDANYQPSPDISPSTNFTLQIWDPSNGTVVRTISDHASFVLRASNRYVEWEDVSQQNTLSVHITDVLTGVTRTFTPKAPSGSVIEGGPYLAPDGPFVAYTVVTPKVAKYLAPSGVSIACCVLPVESAQGRVIVENFQTGTTVLDRSAPVSSDGGTFTPNDSFMVITSNYDHVAFIPLWSASAPVTVVATPQPNTFSDAEDLIITAKR